MAGFRLLHCMSQPKGPLPNSIMQFQVTQIEFDFTDDLYEEALDVESQDEIYDEVLGQIWDVEDEEDLVDEITTNYGWCIKSIDYRHVLV